MQLAFLFKFPVISFFMVTYTLDLFRFVWFLHSMRIIVVIIITVIIIPVIIYLHRFANVQ